MARKARRKYSRRSSGRYLNGSIGLDRGLGTLASKTGIITTTTTAPETCRVSSIKATYTLSDFAPAANIGPVLVVVAHSDYSLAEVEAWVERTASWAPGDKIAQEISRRFIRKIGIFRTPTNSQLSSVLNDGKPIKTRLNWRLDTGQGLQFFLYNLGTVALAGDPNVNIQGNANLWFK